MIVNLFYLITIFNYVISEPICLGGQNHCLRCNTITNLCIKCDKDIYKPDKNGGCEYSKTCIVGNHNCLECNEEGNLCRLCEEGYYPDENGGCSYTDNCEISYKGECIKCKDNYILIGVDDYLNEGIKVCKSLHTEDFKNCKLINETTGKCSECENNYFLNYGDKRCSTTENCFESVFGSCKICNNGYYLNKKDNKCIKQDDSFYGCKETLDGKSCDICNDDYYFDDDKQCTYYNFCSKIGILHTCQKCIEGYYLSEYDKVCTNEEHCYYGHKDTGLCFQCQDNYYFERKTAQCFSNKEKNDFKNCRISDNSKCIQCVYPYYIGGDNKCSDSNHCHRSEEGKCLECMDDFYLGLDNICNVEHCIYSNYNECVECEEGFYYDKLNISCKSTSENEIFKNCKYSRNGDKCDYCKNNYYLNWTDNLCYSNEEKNEFYKCAIVSQKNYCVDCIEGYFTDGEHKCTKVEGCFKSEDENRCLECEEFFCLDLKTGNCIDNDYIEDEKNLIYFRCNKTNKEGNACEECIEGFSVNNKGICVNDTYCDERNEEGICQKCKNDENGVFCLNNIYECVEVYFNDYCLVCNNILDFDNCTRCFDGYNLNENNECVES